MPRSTDVRRRATATSNFGVGARESHDASVFYGRFRPPELSTDDTVHAPVPVADPFVHGDARAMDAVADGSVALVVTSPPYFAGKTYEEELQRDGVPSSYLEYLQMLTDVFAECARTLEPGGRIAINVANLGRKPYRSLSADVIRILEHDLGLLLRGELIWQKGEGASSSCAWGSFRGAANPVLRDISERVIVASKGRFDRARSVKQRAAEGLPHRSTLLTDEFMSLTLDVWHLQPESARRVGHPAPFPVELPEQLIRLYTFADDLVLDPFMGSGSALVAASRLGRRFVGYDLDPAYVALARSRVEAEGAARVASGGTDGRSATAVARTAVEIAGFTDAREGVRIRGAGVAVSLAANDHAGREWLFDVGGPFLGDRGGLLGMDAVCRALGRAAAVRGIVGSAAPLVLLTTALPKPQSDAARALAAAAPSAFTDVIDLFDPAACSRLVAHAMAGTTGNAGRPARE